MSWIELSAIASIMAILVGGVAWVVTHLANHFDRSVHINFKEPIDNLNKKFDKFLAEFSSSNRKIIRLQDKTDQQKDELKLHEKRIEKLEKHLDE